MERPVARRISTRDEGISFGRNHGFPVVVKAFGKSAGKGVAVVQTEGELAAALDAAFVSKNTHQVWMETVTFGPE